MATKTKMSEDYPVLLAELAVVLGTSEEHVLSLLNGDGPHATRDWAGRWVIPASTARALVERQRDEELAREERKAEARARLSEWEQKRQAFLIERSAALTRDLHREWAGKAAEGFANAENVMGDLMRATPPPAVRAEVSRRLREELAEWERKHPRPPAPEEVA